MSLERGFEWSWRDLQFTGYSIAGTTTSLYCKTHKLLFDLGQGLPFQIPAKLLCLSHLHADHGAGLPYFLSQRSLFRMPNIPILLPQKHSEAIERILTEWQGIEEFQYSYHLHPAISGDRLQLSDRISVQALQTTHRVESLAYLVSIHKKKLNPIYGEKSQEQIKQLRMQSDTIHIEIEEPLFAFTGDTQIECLRQSPQLLKVPLLFLECTYLDEKKSVEETRRWGHIHLDEIIEHAELFENETICLIHLSARYSTSEAEKILARKLPETLRGKICLFPRPM